MNDFPVVSVIVPCYNHQDYIEQCILSIVNQTYKHIQLIVIDDGSSDDSIVVLNRLRKKYDFVLELRTNHGLCKTLNYAIETYAIGKYITLIASDDFWETDKLSKQVKFMEHNNDLALSCAKAKIIDKQNNEIGVLGNDITNDSLLFNNLIIRNVIPALTVIFKKEIYTELGGFDEDLYFEDWDFWLRITDKYNLGFLNEYVGFYRKHDNNISSKHLLIIENSIKMCNKWAKYPIYRKAIMEQNFNKIHYLTQKSKKQGAIVWSENLKYFYNIRYWKLLLNLIIKK